MIEKDSQVSLYRAAQVVDRALRRAAELNYQPTRLIHFSDDEWKLKDIRIPSGQDDIRKAYRKYASVAHLIAADMLCSEIFEPALMFARTPEMNAVFINTASVMEDVMRTRQPDHFKDAWLVSPNQSDEVKASGHAPFEGNLVTFLGLGLNTN